MFAPCSRRRKESRESLVAFKKKDDEKKHEIMRGNHRYLLQNESIKDVYLTQILVQTPIVIKYIYQEEYFVEFSVLFKKKNVSFLERKKLNN